MSGSYFYGSMSMVGKSIRKVVISNSRLTTSAVDMNLQNITSVKDPLLSQDAATKRYVDSSADRIATDVTSRFSGYIITLSSCIFSEVINLLPGSYIVTIRPVDDGGPTATFSVSRSSVYMMGFIARITGTPGVTTGEQIELRWLVGQNLELRKTGPGYDGDYIVDMNIKNISALPYEPILETDAATKAYVTNAIKTEMDIKFGGIPVLLEGTGFSNVINLRPGSYMIAVTAIGITGAPTAAFSLSKNSANGEAHVIRTTSCLGNTTNEGLELSWPNNSMVVLRKTGPGFDGDYLVDFNLKNFSSVAPVILPSDSVSKDYVDNKIQELIDIKFGGVTVTLLGTDSVNVINLRPGTYIITITPLVTGGATASFSISKVSSSLPANTVIRLSAHNGVSTNETLDLTWPENQMLMLRKTGLAHDGDYLVDFNLKNIGTSIPTIPNDIATKEYVDEYVRENLDVSYGGIKVTLQGVLYSNVITPRLGSYVIAVSSLVSGGPTATFLLSKSTLSLDAEIVRITTSPPENSDENIELYWPGNSQLLMRKSGPFFDGDYLVDFNLKNFSATTPPIVPSDAATKDFVENLLKQELDLKFGGVIVTLLDIYIYEVVALKAGSYIITVTPVKDGGPTATFSVSKHTIYSEGVIELITSANSGTEAIEILWPSNSKLLIRKSGPGFDGEYIVDFNLKNFSEAPPTTIPSDLASKAYVDNAIQVLTDFKFGGLIIPLEGVEFSDVAVMNPGSYLVSIISKVYGGPSATFSISKSVVQEAGHVAKITSSSGHNTDEKLELSWPSNSKLLLRKTGIFHDGNYIVDLNLKNFGAAVEPVIPNDIATKNFVEETFENKLDAHFSGVKVLLTGSIFVDVAALKAGSYVITVSSVTDGGPTATFNLSKASIVSGIGHVVKTTNSDSSTGETLELIWPENKKVQVRKTGIYNDGEYIVDFNLRNFSVAPTIVDSDAATKAFVIQQIQELMNTKYGGLKVYLENDAFIQIGALKPGSYHITVSPTVDGGASSSFSVSKSSQYSVGHIVKNTSSPGIDFNEELELSWPANSQLLLRKTKIPNDAYYIVDFNLKNFTTMPEPIFSTDNATKNYVNQQIDLLKSQNSVSVLLENTTLVIVQDLQAGAYILSVSSKVPNGPSATFSISKNNYSSLGDINQLTTSLGETTLENLELVWSPNSPLELRKTNLDYDGEYIIDFSSRNFSTFPQPILDTNVVTKEYLDSKLNSFTNEKYNGISVSLDQDIFYDVHDLQPGAYVVSVSSKVSGGPSATFNLSKTSYSTDANIVRVSFTESLDTLETLELSWYANSKLKLRKTGFNYNGIYIVDFNLKNSLLVPQPNPIPINSTNLVTLEYLQEQLDSLQVRNSKMTRLEGVTGSIVDDLIPGAYIIAVSSKVANGPSATFTISKTNYQSEGDVVKTNSSPGSTTLEQLELYWPSNEKLYLRKTGRFYDGDYLVDFSSKNLATFPQPVLDTNVVTKEYLDNKFIEFTTDKYGGVLTSLFGIETYDVQDLMQGSYTISVSSRVLNGPSASFSISKSNYNTAADIVRISSTQGKNTLESLELLWNANSKLQLRKTGLEYDGTYLVDFSSRNFSTVPQPTIETNVVTKEYLDNILNIKFGGIPVTIVDSTFHTVAPLQLGSYTITVSPTNIGGPSAVFSVSKSENYSQGHIVKISSSVGADTSDTLELSWPSNSAVLLRKVGTGNFGTFLVNFNILNLNQDIPLVPLQDTNTSKSITLLGTAETILYSSLDPGSYLVIVSSSVFSAPISTFSVSKGLVTEDAIISTITSFSPPTSEFLTLTWLANSTLNLSKSGIDFDGLYNIKLV
jgi:hypothetical protein